MPIPFLLTGLGVAAGVIGAGGHINAKKTNERAQKRAQDAQDLYNSAKDSLEQEQNKTENALLKLGYEKKNILDTSMCQFLNAYDKIKNCLRIKSVGINEISNFNISEKDEIELRQMMDIYSSSFKSGAAGAATGAIVALAASGSLTVVTGGLEIAVSALLAGEVGAAAGFAGTALSFGAAMTPLAAVAVPVVLFTGISASMKADENLEKANTMYAEAEAASEKMKVSETLCGAITERSEMFNDLLVDLNGMFSECSSLMSGVIRKKEISKDFTEEEINLFAVTRAIAGAVKAVIDTPILSKDGNISCEAEEKYNVVVEGLPEYRQEVEHIKQIDFGVKPIEAKTTKSPNLTILDLTMIDGVRGILAFFLGLIVATVFAENVAFHITNGYYKFLFLEAFTANKIAIWFLICTSVIMLLGRFKGTIVEKVCRIVSGIAISILYVQYCRTVELMNHYIIISIVILFIFCMLYGYLNENMDKWYSASYFSGIFIRFSGYPILFLIYAYFTRSIGFSVNFCLIVTSIMMIYVSLSNVMGIEEE